MAQDRHETAPTLYIQAGSVRFAYRRFGKPGKTPLLLLNHFGATMDDWDPKITNGLANHYEVILCDYPGVGGTSGDMPSTIAVISKCFMSFCHALGVNRIRIVGFSLGGMVAQQLAVDYPDLIERVALLGTGPRGGEDLMFTELSPTELEDPEKLVLAAFFTNSKASTSAGHAYIERLKLRTADRVKPISKQSADAELVALREWGMDSSSDRFAMLSKIHQPTLIVHGAKDIVVKPINAFLLVEQIANAQLIIYPDASHASQSQHADVFLEHIRLFLDH